MNEERRKRLALGLRQHRGKFIKKTWMNDLARACDIDYIEEKFVPLEETAQLKESFFLQVKTLPELRLFWPISQQNLIVQFLDTIKQQFSAEIILFSQIDSDIGALQLQSTLILEHAFQVWEVVKEDLALATHTLADGLCLERNQYGRYQEEYELTIWGAFTPASNAVITGSYISSYREE